MNPHKSPFEFGTTVKNDTFTNRITEQERLESNLVSGINTILISPRRWGKTSLVDIVLSKIATSTDIKVVHLDLFSTLNFNSFLQHFAKQVIKASASTWQEWMDAGKQWFTNIIPHLSVGIDPQTDFNISFTIQEEETNALEVLALPQKIAEKKGVRYVICLDEFQQAARWKKFATIEKMMRSVWQKQDLVTYCLYGSKKHMMSEIFNQSDRPFYRFGDMMFLQKITVEDWKNYIKTQFISSTKRISDDVAGLIAELVSSHSWYVQQLSHYSWLKTESECTKDHVLAALEELIHVNTPFYQQIVESLTGTQINFLLALSNGETQITSTRVMTQYRLGTPNNVNKIKQVLLEKDIIDQTTFGIEFQDPVFEKWFYMQFK